MMRRSERAGDVLALCDQLEALICKVRKSVADPGKRLLDEQGSLTPTQAQARLKRDQKRTQRIQKINADAMAKANDVRAKMGD